MRAARLTAPRTIRCEDIPDPEPGENDVLVRVGAVGLCGSDLHYFCDGHIGTSVASEPLVLGHEFAGTVESVGPNVRGFLVGDRVAVDPAIPCGRCEVCLEGHPNICPSVRFAGTPPTDGALRELLVWPAQQVVRLPDGMDLDSGAALETLGVCLHALNLSHLRLADRVAVLGVGPIGLLIVRLARLAGAAEIYVTDPNPKRLAAALALGADDAVQVGVGDPVVDVVRLTGGRGVDVSFEAAGALETPQQGIDMLRPGGTLVLVGICPEDRIPLAASTSRRKGVTIKLSRRMKHVYPRTIALVQRGMVDLHQIISHHYPLAQTPEAFEHLARAETDALKVIIQPQK
ncbi:MAG TPA: alcohol dehydrogenase catalytic domain-containing protein [Chloroflexota bacterium]|nr:alcohol dehydrogenase catalytic domain-containing protein [Chloroflexota bacterium]